MLHSLDERFRAIAQLQTTRARHTPGSAQYEQVEHAIDLVLGDLRTIDNYLIRNVLRDAQRVAWRQFKSSPHVQIADDLQPGDEDERCTLPEVLQDTTTPYQLCEAKELVEKIIASVATSSRHASRVMEGLLIGESLDETAKATGLTSDRINQIRRLLRTAATKLLGSRLGHH